MIKNISKQEQIDVDARFLLANERTLLAWIRTSLAIEAGGIALLALHNQQRFVGATILMLGVAVAFIGYHRYQVADKAIRAHRLPPAGIGPAVQLFAVVFIALIFTVAQLLVWR